MGVWTYFSFPSSERTEVVVEGKPDTLRATVENIAGTLTQEATAPDVLSKASAAAPAIIEMNTSTESTGTETSQVDARIPENQVKVRLFSMRSLAFVKKDSAARDKPILSATREHQLRENVSAAKLAKKTQLSKSQRKAHKSALAVRDIIVGPSPNAAAPRVTPAYAKPQLSKIKSQLLDPKSAKQVIAHLKQLPLNDGSAVGNGQHGHGPIHAVCLQHTDAEEHLLHFGNLPPPDRERSLSVQDFNFPGVSSAPLDAVSKMFKEMQIINLVGSPDFGLGQPGDGEGILAGALPTPETVIEGIKQITPELMALGFATSKAITPDHSQIYPPTDRMSVLTYWWGLEILLPPPSLVYLAHAHSISPAVMNFLTAVSLVNNGVREILPFIRYISQFIDFEFSSIQKQDQGFGVVCAATWIMPAALVPRPWDFPVSPAGSSGSPEADQQRNSGRITTPPLTRPGQISSVSDIVISSVPVAA